jgi:hypothetical protein
MHRERLEAVLSPQRQSPQPCVAPAAHLVLPALYMVQPAIGKGCVSGALVTAPERRTARRSRGGYY